MRITLQPIMGIHLGFELYDSYVEDIEVGYLLVDILVIRIQFAWYK
jgi:hypothetical protein|tara:strand:+ start:497 stop:634 length:138 start_codon:yes stop_codon:yes gene_type:complete